MRRLNVLTCIAILSAAAVAQTAVAKNPNAIIQTTAGDFTCELFKDKVPAAVDNFVGLATGTKDWRDPVTRAKKHGKLLYDGTVFHRVISDFMIQGGDPLANGQGDPGYSFKDEFAPGLNFSLPGMLAYANSGPNTNGSQFFITEVPVPFLDPCMDAAGCTRQGRHVPKGYGYTIFGQCTPVSLVSRIARVPKDPNDKPYHPTKIIHIKILKPGESATAPAPEKSATGAAKKPAASPAKRPVTTPK
jgi:peptidyl-prolyl cis-trans isomerase A (cyclophilin A)